MSEQCTASDKKAFATCVDPDDCDTCVKVCEMHALPPGTILAFLQKLAAMSPQLISEFMVILNLFAKPVVPPAPADPTPAP